jgi:hypothetical protein
MENNLAKISPTQLSLAQLRADGWFCWITEHWNSYARIRQDLWGFVDIIALKPNQILGVQTTTASNMAARCRKIADHENVGKVRESGVMLHVHGWHMDAKTKKWSCKVKDIS